MAKKTKTVQLECPKCKVHLTVRADTVDEDRNCWRCNTLMVLPENGSDTNSVPENPDKESTKPAETTSEEIQEVRAVNTPTSAIQSSNTDQTNVAEQTAKPQKVETSISENITGDSSLSIDPLSIDDQSEEVPQKKAKNKDNSFKSESETSLKPKVDVELDELIKVPVYNDVIPLTPEQEKAKADALRDAAFDEDDFDLITAQPTTVDVTKPGWKLEKPGGGLGDVQTKKTSDSEPSPKDDLELEDIPSTDEIAPISLSDDPFDALKIESIDEEIPKKPTPKDPQPIPQFKGKEKPQFRFDCLICSALIYSTEDKIGTDVLCHECDSVMTVPKPTNSMFVKVDPRATAPDPLSNSEEDDDGEIKLSEPVELPKYQMPVSNESDESEIEPPALQSNKENKVKTKTIEIRSTKKTVDSEPDLLAPIPSPKSTSDPKSTQPETSAKKLDDKPKSDKDESDQSTLKSGTKKTSRKELLSEIEADSESTKPEINEDRWFSEMFAFFKDIHTIVRLFFVSLLVLAFVILLGLIDVYSAEGGIWAKVAFGLWIGAMCLLLITMAVLFVIGSSIIGSTSQAKRKIEGWAELEFSEWLNRALPMMCAAFVGSLPGFLLSQPFACAGLGYFIIMPLAVLLSLWLIFPFASISTMENQSPWGVYSQTIFDTLKPASNLWKSLYAQTGVCAICAIPPIFICLLLQYFFIQMLGSIVISAILFMYFRLLGYHAFRLTEFLKSHGR